MPSSQNSTGPSPCQEWLDLPEEGHPGSPGLFFSWTQFPCPLLRCQSGQRLHLSPSCCPAAPAPAVEGGEQSVSPRRGTEGEEVVCVCLLPWPKHCASWQSEGAFAGCQEWGTKKENPGRLPAAAAAEAAAADPGLIC